MEGFLDRFPRHDDMNAGAIQAPKRDVTAKKVLVDYRRSADEARATSPRRTDGLSA
jgi:hypothetical protein